MTGLLDSTTAQSIVLYAPAGYGKTSLAAEWLAVRDKVGWYRATQSSADVAAFSVELSDAAAAVVPDIGRNLRQRLRVGEAPEAVAWSLAELLAEDLRDWPDGAWLVVDDYHCLVDSRPVEDFVDRLLGLTPRLRLLVTTRRRPDWASARRVLYGEVAEVGPDQLALTDEEAAQLLDGRPSDAVKAILAQAGGWPALIGLAALSGTAKIPSEQVSDDLFRYFADEVVRQRSQGEQRFMMVASLPQTVNLTLCEEVLGLDDPEPIIVRLVDEGLLTESSPGELAFHPLLRDFLRRRLDVELPHHAEALGSKVISYARTAERWQEAFEIAIRAERISEAVEIVGDASPSLLAAGQIETLEKWLDRCGPTVARSPLALLARAEILLRRGRIPEAGNLALTIAQSASDETHEASRAWCIAGKAMHLVSDETRALEFHERAVALSRTPDERAESLWGAFLSACDLEIDRAEALLQEFSSAAATVDIRLRSAVGAALLGQRRGRIRDSIGLMCGTSPLASLTEDPIIQSCFLLTHAYMDCLRLRYKSAEQTVCDGLSLCSQIRLSYGETYFRSVRALVELGLRQYAAARSTIRLVQQAGRDVGDPAVLAIAAALSLRVDLCEGKRPTESSITTEPLSQEVPRFIVGELTALRSLALAARGDVDEARSLALSARTATKGIEASFISQFAELTAAAFDSTDSELSAEAVVLLEKCLIEETLEPALLAFRASHRLAAGLWKTEARPFVAEVVRRANDQVLAGSLGFELRPLNGTLSHLTPREKDVLGLMCKGLSNQEIARELVVELSTAKSHVHRVLGKLNARNRVEAILLAMSEGFVSESP